MSRASTILLWPNKAVVSSDSRSIPACNIVTSIFSNQVHTAAGWLFHLTKKVCPLYTQQKYLGHRLLLHGNLAPLLLREYTGKYPCPSKEICSASGLRIHDTFVPHMHTEPTNFCRHATLWRRRVLASVLHVPTRNCCPLAPQGVPFSPPLRHDQVMQTEVR